MDKNNINIDCILLLDKYSIEKNSFKYFVGYKNSFVGHLDDIRHLLANFSNKMDI